ncbi:helix-turn-helix domain-containing protein [Olegusella massiliensis]|uniref:helix-turn-helix domain-containing protein n=1 Tax=Olegusella massiliensis TaxID=1776381 RepID=UPI0023F65288|nr:helix-turn-helix domain-containing protein [Olegusella massiliensis]
MLNENIKALRKSKGLSQDDLAIKLNVVRQTVSKWERGLSVPDSEMLISISDIFEVPTSTLLGENIAATEADELKVISEKLEVINFQLAQQKEARRKRLRWFLILLCVAIVIIFAVLLGIDGSYLKWDYSDPETAVMGTIIHSFEWAFVRLAPIVLVGAGIGIILIEKKSC